MKAFLVFAAFLALAVAEPPSTGYGQPEAQPQLNKNVYVYTAPDEAPESQSRVIRVPGGDKHVNIIFVKTPSSASSHQTEVVLPEQDEHKNLVYVLLKKAESSADVKIRKPAPRPQPKPEVSFIRYSDNKAAGYQGSGPSSGGPPQQTYGAPSF